MMYDSYDEINDNEVLDSADSIHDEDETATEGRPLVKKRFKRTVDNNTRAANPLDSDLIAASPVTKARRLNSKSGLLMLTKPENAKKQIKDKLEAAKKGFVMPEVDPDDDEEEPRKAIVNGTMKRSDFDGFKAATEADLKNPSYRHGSKIDNGPSGILRVIDDEDEVEHKIEESWHVRDAITRGYLGKDIEDQARMLSTLRRLRKDCDTGLLDSVGVSVHTPGKDDSADYSLQKDKNGNVVYDLGQTLDRKKVSKVRKDGMPEAIYDGAVRKASKSGVTHGFDPSRDDLLAFAIIMAANNIEEIQASIGPLWPILMSVVCDNAKLATIGYMFEKTDPQASAVGSVIIKIALEEVAQTYERIDAREANSLSYAEWLDKQPNSLAVPARKLRAALHGNDNSPPSLAIAPDERQLRSEKSPRTKQREIVTRAMNDINLADLTLLAKYAIELKTAPDGIGAKIAANDNEKRYHDAIAA